MFPKNIFIKWHFLAIGMALFALSFSLVFADEYVPGQIVVNFKTQYLPILPEMTPDGYVVTDCQILT
jgi:hypothetical protein